MKYFTSDLHLGHKHIIEYCKRPFSSVEEMDRALIHNWNEVVNTSDEVYVLGDFSFYNSTKTKHILSQLNGRKILVKGNHDLSLSAMGHRGFDLVVPNAVIRLNDKVVFLSHYPFQGKEDDNRKYPGMQFIDDGQTFLLHGHVHCGWKRKERMINVGVDVNQFTPVSEQTIKDMMKTK